MFTCETDMRLATSSGLWPFDADQWRGWLREPGLHAYFLRRDGQDAGHFALRARGKDRHLSWVIVPPAHRGGTGRALLTCAAEEARALGASVLTLNVFSNNARAGHLYRSFGFAPVSEQSGKIAMRLDLGA